MTFLLRLSPAIPFNLFNYMMGITKVPLAKYTIGGLGMIPGTIVYVYFGTAISNISDAAAGNFDGGVLQLVLFVGGSVLAIIAVCYVSYVARKEVKKVLKKNADEKAIQDADLEKGSGEQKDKSQEENSPDSSRHVSRNNANFEVEDDERSGQNQRQANEVSV